ncbi:MAG: hypothetical protein IPP60_11050 [Sphingobacteriales bacterium]|nr:hypothetical protein [Sphingobacteriales bacterium]
MLFSVAGFLNKDFVEIYPRELKQEYEFLKQIRLEANTGTPLAVSAHSAGFFSDDTYCLVCKSNAANAFVKYHFRIKRRKSFLDNIEVSEYWNDTMY